MKKSFMAIRCMHAFEGIGVLAYQNLIDVDLVSELMSRHVIWFWEKMEPISMEMRRRLNLPRMDEKIKYLYAEVKKREQRLQHARARNNKLQSLFFL